MTIAQVGVENFLEGLFIVHVSNFFRAILIVVHFGIVRLNNLARDNVRFSAIC